MVNHETVQVKGSDDLVLKVPVGTRAIDQDTGEQIGDLTYKGKSYLLLRVAGMV